MHGDGDDDAADGVDDDDGAMTMAMVVYGDVDDDVVDRVDEDDGAMTMTMMDGDD